MWPRTILSGLLWFLVLGALMAFPVDAQRGLATTGASSTAPARVPPSSSAFVGTGGVLGVPPVTPAGVTGGPVIGTAGVPEVGLSATPKAAPQAVPQVAGTDVNASATPAPRRSREADSELLQHVRRQLRRFPGVALDVTNGVITVRAGALTPAEHERLFELVRTIPGARGVIVRFRAG